jgi:hypothetical protein
MLKHALRFAFLGWTVLAFIAAGPTPPGFGPDPFYLNETSIVQGNAGWRDTSGKTLSGNGQTVNTGIVNCVIIAAGQSNFGNTSPDAYSPSNPNALDNLNIYDGAIYKAADALVGAPSLILPPTTEGHPALILGDALVTAGKCARVIIVPCAVNGTSVAQWAGQLSNRIPTALGRLAARGITSSTTNVTIVLLWGQGEADTLLGTSQASYVASWNAMIAAANLTGVRALVAKETLWNTATSAALQAAQTQNATSGVINNSAGIYLGANADALQGNICGSGTNTACRQADGNHWSDAGAYSYAIDPTYGWQQALHATGSPF